MNGTLYATCYHVGVISVAFAAMPVELIVEDLTQHGPTYIAAKRRDAEDDICEHGWDTYSEADARREMILNGWRVAARFKPENRPEQWTVWEKRKR